jgi:hypothetical protein
MTNILNIYAVETHFVHLMSAWFEHRSLHVMAGESEFVLSAEAPGQDSRSVRTCQSGPRETPAAGPCRAMQGGCHSLLSGVECDSLCVMVSVVCMAVNH